jgi:hypothetical protein
MAVDFRTIDRDTPYILPPSVQDYVPQGHLARFVVEIVDQLDLGEMVGAYDVGERDSQVYLWLCSR